MICSSQGMFVNASSVNNVYTLPLTTLKISSINMDGLSLYSMKKLAELQYFVRKVKPDIFMVQEHKYKEGLEPFKLLSGYTPYFSSHSCSAEKRPSSSKWGVVTFVRNGIAAKVTNHSGIFQARVQEVDLIFPKKDSGDAVLKLYNIYAPTGSDKELKKNFYKKLYDLLKKRKKSDGIMLFGDFNDKLLPSDQFNISGSNSRTEILYDFFQKCDELIDVVRVIDPEYDVRVNPSIKRKKNGYCGRIDYIFSNFTKGIKNAYIDSTHFFSSDNVHSPLFLKLDLQEWGNVIKQIHAPLILPDTLMIDSSNPSHKLRMAKVCENWLGNLDSELYETFTEDSSSEKRKEKFSEAYEAILDLLAHRPKAYFKTRRSVLKSERDKRTLIEFDSEEGRTLGKLVWTKRAVKAFIFLARAARDEIQVSQKKRRHFTSLIENVPKNIKCLPRINPVMILSHLSEIWFRKLKTLQKSLESRMDQFFKKRNSVLRANWNEELISEANSNSSKFRQMLFRTYVDVSCPTAVNNSQGELVVEPDKVKEIWHKYFQEYMKRVPCNADLSFAPMDETGSIIDEVKEKVKDFYKKNNTKTLMKKMNMERLELIIKNLPKKKCMGLDWVQNESVKLITPPAKKFLLGFLNTIIVDKVCPEFLRKALVIPLYKKRGSVFETDNYREVWVLSMVIKLIDANFDYDLKRLLEHKRLLQPIQSGSSRTLTCGMNIQIYVNIQVDAKMSDKEIHMAIVDVVKAYPSVSFSGLAHSLRSIGVDENTIKRVMLIYTRYVAIIRTPHGLTEKVYLGRGSLAGSKAAVDLFVLFMDMLFRELAKSGLGYKITYKKDSINIPATAIVDDLTLYAETRKDLQKLIDIVSHFFNFYGMVISPKIHKSTYTTNRLAEKLDEEDGLLEETVYITDVSGTKIPISRVASNRAIRSVGYDLTGELDWSAHSLRILVKAQNTLRDLQGKWAPLQSKSLLVNSDVWGLITYSSDVVPFDFKDLKKLQTLAKKAVCYPAMSASFAADILSLPPSYLGMSLGNISDIVTARLIAGMNMALNSENIICSKSTDMIWRKIQFYANKGAYPLEKFIPSPEWKKLPRQFSLISQKLQELSITIKRKEPHCCLGDVSIRELLSYQDITPHRRVEPIIWKLEERNYMKMKHVSRWFAESKSAPSPMQIVIDRKIRVYDSDLRKIKPVESILDIKGIGRKKEKLWNDVAHRAILKFLEKGSQRYSTVDNGKVNSNMVIKKVFSEACCVASDGSKGLDGSTLSNLGIATDSNNSIFATIKGRQSVPRAEAKAALVVLKNFPPDKPLTLFMDAKSIVDTIIKHDEGLLEWVYWKKRKNRSVLKEIIHFIEERTASTSISYIKAHTGALDEASTLNDKADRLAKGELVPDVHITVEESLDFVDNYYISENGCLFEGNVFSFIKKKLRGERACNTLIEFASARNFDMEGFVLKPSTASLRLAPAQGLRYFTMKMFTSTLPTFSVMSKRYPHLYENTDCIMCKAGCEETATHLFLKCKNTRTKRFELRKKINTLIARDLKGSAEIIPWFDYESDFYDCPEDDQLCGKIPEKIYLSNECLVELKLTTLIDINLTIMTDLFDMWKNRNKRVKQQKLNFALLETNYYKYIGDAKLYASQKKDDIWNDKNVV